MYASPFHEHIHLYVEGLLPEYAETALFAELAANADLRTFLSEELRLLANVKHHAASIQAAPATKSFLFAELGLSEETTAAAATSSANSAKQRISTSAAALGFLPNIKTLSVSALSSLATVLVMMFFFRTGINTVNMSNNNPSSKSAAIISEVFFPEAMYLRVMPRTISPNAALTQPSPKGRGLQSAQELSLLPPLPREARGEGWGEGIESITPPEPSNQALSTNLTPSNQALSTTAQTEVSALPKPVLNEQTPSTQALSNQSTNEPLPVRLTLRHSLGGTEFGLHGGISYALSKQHTIGFEGGTEGAQLLLRRTQFGGEVTRIGEGQTPVFSVTAFYRYSFTQLALTPTQALMPFVQAGFGVVGRCGAVQGMAGVRFDVIPELSFILAADAKLPVLFAEQHFQSKAGLSIGMQYQFSDK